MDEKTIVNVIVDLYEMRASVLVPLQARKIEKVQNVFQYNFFNSVIANLSDKYKVRYEDIEEVIREREADRDAKAEFNYNTQQ